MTSSPKRTVRLAGVSIDPDARRVVRRGHTLTLTSFEARLFTHLHAHAGREVPRAELLREVWGYHPTVQSRTLDTTVRRLREKIELDPGAPRHLLTAHGVGYVLVGVGGAPHEDDPIGRDGAITEALDALERHRVVTLTGRPGQGCTTVARAVARRWGPSCEVGCQDLGEDAPVELDRRLVAATGFGAGRSVRDAVRALTRGGDLLVLDGAGGAEPAVARWLRQRLAELPSTRVLVTARAPTGVDGEHPLALLGLTNAAATVLLTSWINHPGTPGDGSRTLSADAVANAVAWCDGWPLALELVAARLRILGDAGAMSSDPRLDHALEAAWSRTPPLGRDTLLAAAVVAAPFDVAWVSAVAGVEVAASIPDLVQQAWIRSDLPGRFTMAELIRSWLLGRADPGLFARHADAVLQVAERAPESTTWEGDAALALRRREVSADRQRALATHLAQAWLGRAPPSAVIGVLAVAEAHPPPVAPEGARHPALLRGRLAELEGDEPLAYRHFAAIVEEPARTEAEIRLAYLDGQAGRRASAEARLAGLPAELAPDHALLVAYVRAADLLRRVQVESVAAWRGVCAMAERLGRRRLVARWTPSLAVALSVAEREEEAEAMFGRAIAALAEIGDVRTEAFSRTNLAQLRYDRGDLAAAEALLSVAAELFLLHENATVERHALAVRATIALERAAPERALSLLAEADTLPGGAAFSLAALRGIRGSVLWYMGDLAAAEAELAASLEGLERAHAAPRLLALTRARLLAVRCERGEAPEGWPAVVLGDKLAAGVQVEVLHGVLLEVRRGERPIEDLRAAWDALAPPRSGVVRVSRLLLREVARRAGIEMDVPRLSDSGS